MKKEECLITNQLILTAGPCIDYREPTYAADAALNGWNHHHSEYLNNLEKYFAEYIGVKYAKATSSCTGALHLALLAMGVGPGDEVIVPETTWIATAAAVIYVGATPIFADIETDTWVMDPRSVEKLITPKTKVIIPVHLYGQPVDMDPILKLAKKHNIEILEDAAPSIGTIYKGKKTGSFGSMAAFSFQGAKAVVTGEGGALISNSEGLINKAWFYNDHGRDPKRTLYNIAIGYKYKMSNVQAAIGLAQMEKVEDIVNKKRQIFFWYQERLKDLSELELNVERPNTRNIYWMSSIVIDKKLKYDRDEFMMKLKERNIDSRPMFYPMSSFKMFDSKKEVNKVAYDVPLRGINLPSGHERTEEEIDYICAHIRNILNKSAGRTSLQPQGFLAHRDKVENYLKEAKEFSQGSNNTLPISHGKLVPITEKTLMAKEEINDLAKWRDSSQIWFPSQFKVTFEGTKKWIEVATLKQNDRILYFIYDNHGTRIGHVGLFRFNHRERYCELDNIVRGVKDKYPGVMEEACNKLLEVCFLTLGLESVCLKVFSDNEKAIKLYKRLGMWEIQRTPLMKVQKQGNTTWVEIIGQPYKEAERYSVTMKIDKKTWKGNNKK